MATDTMLDALNGHPLRVERCRHNLTLHQLAERVQISVSTIWRAENGFLINAESRRRLCTYFGKTSQELGLFERRSKTYPHAIATEQRSLEAVVDKTTLIPQPREAPVVIFQHGQPLNVEKANEQEISFEEQLGSWLAIESCNIGSLFDAGWTLDAILESLRVVLQSVQGMPPEVRKKLARLGNEAMINNVIQSIESISDKEQIPMYHMLAASITDGWKYFQTANNKQVLATAYACLHLLQKYHITYSTDSIAKLYSSTYRLVGISQLFQGRYNDGLHSYRKAYLTALETSDAWNMAESLGAQAGIWKACGQQEKAIQVIEAAIRLIKQDDNLLSHATQARLHAQAAESAALLRNTPLTEKMLEESYIHYNFLTSENGFDDFTWSYYRGTCAFYLGNSIKAIEFLDEALKSYPEQWRLQRTNTLLFKAKAHLHSKDWQKSLEVAQLALSGVIDVDAPIILWGFMDFVDDLRLQFPTHPEITFFSKRVSQQLHVPSQRSVSRYLEGKL